MLVPTTSKSTANYTNQVNISMQFRPEQAGIQTSNPNGEELATTEYLWSRCATACGYTTEGACLSSEKEEGNLGSMEGTPQEG